MDNKVISFSVDELAVDSDDVIGAVNDACSTRHLHYRLRGVCQLEGQVYFMLIPLRDEELPEKYVIAELDDLSHDGFIATVNSRYLGGFDPVGAIKVYDTHMLVFAKGAE